MTIGTTEKGELFSISESAHTAVFGKTGTGKSNLLEHIIFNAIARGDGVTVLDPHGTLVDAVMTRIPPERTNDVILFDPSAERVPGLDALAGDLAAESTVSIFRGVFPDSWGARSEWLLQGFITALSEYHKPVSLLSLHKALHSKSFRDKLPDTHGFIKTIHGWTPKFREEAFSPLINKIGRMVINDHLRVSLGQTKVVSFEQVLKRRQIYLARLSKGEIGETASMLLGSIILSRLTQCAMAGNTRRHVIVIDEVQNFVHGISLSTVLSEARKYGVQLVVASQYLAQVDSAPIFGNCGTLIAFRASGADAEILSKEMATNILAPGFQNIPDYHCRVTTLQNKQPTAVQYVSVLPPLPKYDSVREASLRRWGNPRGKVEARIKRHLN